MGDKYDLDTVDINIVYRMLLRLLTASADLKFGYVVQLVFELLSTFTALEQGMKKTHISSFDKYNAHNTAIRLLLARNLINHNAYDYPRVVTTIKLLLKDRVVETLYNSILGTCEGYDLFETEAYVYLEYMKRLWKE